MMTLVEANNMVTPILKSWLVENDIKLLECMDAIKALIPEDGYRVKNPFHWYPIEILDSALEEAFLALIQRYEELTGEDLQVLRHIKQS